MQRLEWHWHTKSVSGALYKAILYHGQSAGKEMANSAVFNFRRNACRLWLDFPDRSWKRIPGTRRSSRKRTITNGGSTCRWYDECRRRSRPDTKASDSANQRPRLVQVCRRWLFKQSGGRRAGDSIAICGRKHSNGRPAKPKPGPWQLQPEVAQILVRNNLPNRH